ncbi:MAG: trypsin-like serine peptidase [Gaiellaceae bacterium]
MRKRLLLVVVLLVVVAAVFAVVVGARLIKDEAAESGGARSLPLKSFDELASGVVLIEILDCQGEPLIVSDGIEEHRVTGSGFLVGSRVVMTAEHMIPVRSGGACGMRVRVGDHSYDVAEMTAWGEPGDDDRRGIDVATLTLARDAPGHIFEFAAETERVGSRLAVLGYPLGGPLRISKAVITRKVTDYDKPRLAAKITPEAEGGNSGGPIVNDRGEVVSVVSGIVIYANLTNDGTHRGGGIDIPLWWGESVRNDLCRAHPDGGIPGCDPGSVDEATKAAVDVPGPG